jgi:hypothetical protein
LIVHASLNAAIVVKTNKENWRVKASRKHKVTKSLPSKKARGKNSSSIPAAVGERNMKTKISKRKRRDDDNHPTPKKAATSKNGVAVRVPQTYREPKGIRKSKRIAGQPADESGISPKSQYARRVRPSNTESPADSTPELPNASAVDRISDVKGDEADTNGRAQIRQQEFLKALAGNVGTHRIVRYVTHEYTKWTQRIAALKHARGGIVELDAQVRRMERDASHSQEDMYNARKRRDNRQGQLDHATTYVDSLIEPLGDLNAKHFDRNNRIYEFVDIPRNGANLQCLPSEFWTAYEDCNAAYAASKDVELEIQELEQEQLEILRRLDERMEDSVLRGSEIYMSQMGTTEHVPFREPFEHAAERIRDLGGTSVKLSRLVSRLEAARDTQYDRESRLNRISEDAFVVAGFLDNMIDIAEIKFHRRLQIAHVSQDPHSEPKSDLSGSIEGETRSARQVPTKARLAAQVKQARKNLRAHRRRLDDVRWRHLSDAGSKDSDARGQLRVRKMIQRTGEFREAEDEYRSILHRAQNDHAISESDQSSNFRDHESNGYGASSLRSMGYPIAQERKDRVHDWMVGGLRRRKPQLDGQPAEASEEEGTWFDRVKSMAFGEDPEGRDIDRWKKRIDALEKERDSLRNSGPFEKAENDFHPRNIGTATNTVKVNQQEDAVSLDLG